MNPLHASLAAFATLYDGVCSVYFYLITNPTYFFWWSLLLFSFEVTVVSKLELVFSDVRRVVFYGRRVVFDLEDS